MVIQIDGIPAEVVRKRMKTLRLTVLPPDGRVRISAPLLLPNSVILAFAESKADWVRKQQEKMRERQARQPAEMRYVSGETLEVWGKPYVLRVMEGTRWALSLERDTALLTARTGSTQEQREAHVNGWYREMLKIETARRLPVWEEMTGLRCASWQVKNMKTRWGTCNPNTRKVWLSLQLARKPLECLDYVILHELTHLKVRNHGKDFQAFMDRYMPDWRERRKQLK